jgi:hypothetical protein
MSTDRFDLLRKSSYKSSDLLIDIDRFDNGQDIIRISSRYREVGSYYYEGLLLNVSGMDERLPIDCQFKLQGDALMTFANSRLMCQTPAEPMPKISDLLAEGLMGAKVTIRQFYEGCIWTDVDDEYAFTGWIKSEQIQYDENELVLTVSPVGKKLSRIPPYRMHEDDYSTMDTEGEGLIMPIVLGLLTNTNKLSHDGVTDMDAVYGGAYLLSNKYILKSLPDYRLLVAGHVCYINFNLYKELTKYASPTYHLDDAGGPDWRQITTLELDTAIWDATKDWSCDTEGIHNSLRDPIQHVKQVLTHFYGMRGLDDDISEIDYTTSQIDFSNYLLSTALACDALIKTELSVAQFFTKMMGQFPFHIYRGRDGKIYFKKWERKPAVDYTEKKPNDVCQGGYFQRAFIQCTIQDSGYTLDEDLTDSELDWTITGSGIMPVNNDLVLVGREICEVKLPNTPTGSVVTVWRRGGNGTDAVEHSDGDAIYLLRTDSNNGRRAHDQMGVMTAASKTIEIYEDAVHHAAVTISPEDVASYYKDAERLADNVAEQCNADADLDGVYACEWNPETNFYRLYTTNSVEFMIKQNLSDGLVKVLGWWADTGMAEEHFGDLPARKRECQAAYDTVMYRDNSGWELRADWVVGSGLTANPGGDFEGDLTPIVTRDYRFDISHRPMKRVKFSAPNRFYNLLIGKIFEFDTDINDYLKVHGQNFTELNWRVINARRVDMNTLRFIAEEAT